MASAPKTVVTNSSKRFHQFEIFGPMMSKKAGHSTKNANANAKGSPKRQSIRTIQNFVSQQTGARQTNRMPSNLERAYREYEAFASGRDISEIHSYYNKTGKSAYTIENGRIVRNPNFTRDQDYYTYKAPYRDKEPSKYNAENYWGYGSFDKWVKGKNAPKYSQVNYWQEGTSESDMWNKYHNFRDPNWARDEKMLSTMSKEDADKWRSQHWSHDKLYENEAEFRKDKAKEARSAEQRYFARRDFINNQTPEEKQKYHDENYVTHHNKRNVLDRILGPLANNTLAQVAYAGVTGGDKSDAAIQSLKYMLPTTDDVSDRRYWSDVFKVIDDKLAKSGKSIAISPSGSPFAPIKTVSGEDVKNNTANALVGLMMDIGSDPLTYVSGGFSAGAKILKGTGATKKELDAAREIAKAGNDFASSKSAKIISEAREAKHTSDLRNVEKQYAASQLRKNRITKYTDEDLERYVDTHDLSDNEVVKQMKRDQVDNVANQMADARRRSREVNIDYLADDIDMNSAREILLESNPNLANQPKRLEQLTYEFIQRYARNVKGMRGANEGKGFSILGKEIVSAQKLRAAGNKTVAPMFNVANRKLRSTLGLAFSDNNKLLRYANKVGDDQAFSTVYGMLLADRFGMADKNIKSAQVADKLNEFFSNATEEQIVDFVLQHDKGTYKNMLNYEKQFSDIRQRAVEQLRKTNPELAQKYEDSKNVFDTISDLTESFYNKVDQDMKLRDYKSFANVLDNKEQQLAHMLELRGAGIDVGNIEDFTNQINYLKQNKDIIGRHYKDIYKVYGKTVDNLSFEETQNAIGLMKDLEDIATLGNGDIPWNDLLKSYRSTYSDSNNIAKQFRSMIAEKKNIGDVSDFMKNDIDADRMAEVVRKYRDDLIDIQTAELVNSGYYDDLANLPFNEAYMLSPAEYSIWKNLHYDEMVTPVHYDIDNISKLLNRDEYTSAYKNIEQEYMQTQKAYGQAVRDEMKTMLNRSSSLNMQQIDDMLNLYENQDFRAMHDLFAEKMYLIGKEEVAMGDLNQEVLEKLSAKYIPREISTNAKNFWEKLFGEPFEQYVKEPGKFNPVQGEHMTFNQQRTFKTMEDGERWYAQQVKDKVVKDLMAEHKDEFQHVFGGVADQKTFEKYIQKRYGDVINEYTTAAGKLYNYNVSELFINRAIGHNELMQSDVINNLVKARLSTVYTGTKTSDKIVIPYIDIMQDCRRLAGVGEFGEMANGQQVFDYLMQSVGINPQLVGKNISHFEVTDKQLGDIMHKIENGLITLSKGKKVNIYTQGYNMDKTVYNMLNRYTKAQMKIMQNDLLNLYDGFLTKFKVLNTIINPGFHGQNAPSNMFQSFLAIGANAFNLHRLKKAFNIIRTGDPNQTITLGGKTYTYKEMRRIFQEYNVIDNTFYNDFKYTKEADNFTESQLRDVSMEDFNNFFKNDFKGGLSFLNPVADLANKPFKYMGLLGSSIEGTQRANLFMSCLDMGYDFRESVEMVNKYLFDYGDLTNQEQQIFKRIIPFYSFLRKNVPMELEAMLEQPHKFVNTRRTFDTISRMSEDYIPADERNEYRDTDIQIPVPIDGSYYGLSDNMPYTQFEKWTDINKAVGQTSPLVKLPIELATRRYAYTGMDIDSPSSYLMNQIPALKAVERHLHDKNFGSNPPDADPDYEPDLTRRRMWDIGQMIGFPINKISRQEYNKNYGDFYEQYENDPGTIADLLNIIRSRDINSVLDRYR